MRKQKVLTTDFHSTDRKISMTYWKRKSHHKSFVVPNAFLILWKYVIFFNDITNETISQNIEKDKLIKILKVHLQKNTQIEVNKNCT